MGTGVPFAPEGMGGRPAHQDRLPAGLGLADGSPEAISRVVQGVAAGIGFLGAGTILKLSDTVEVKGLTTAASIWLAAALGTSAGLKMVELALAGLVVSVIVLAMLRPIDKRFGRSNEDGQESSS